MATTDTKRRGWKFLNSAEIGDVDVSFGTGFLGSFQKEIILLSSQIHGVFGQKSQSVEVNTYSMYKKV